jgi:hypothetical protein
MLVSRFVLIPGERVMFLMFPGVVISPLEGPQLVVDHNAKFCIFFEGFGEGVSSH